MSTDSDGSRTLLVDASVFISLAHVDSVSLLRSLRGRTVVPGAVVDEITDDPAASELETALDEWLTVVPSGRERAVADEMADRFELAASHLGVPDDRDWSGDVALLAWAMQYDDAVVISDDRPLRETCKALSIRISGSIGVLVRAVERGDLDVATGKDRLYGMDEVGARLSASLVRRAERLLEDAADD